MCSFHIKKIKKKNQWGVPMTVFLSFYWQARKAGSNAAQYRNGLRDRPSGQMHRQDFPLTDMGVITCNHTPCSIPKLKFPVTRCPCRSQGSTEEMCPVEAEGKQLFMKWLVWSSVVCIVCQMERVEM